MYLKNERGKEGMLYTISTILPVLSNKNTVWWENLMGDLI